MSNLQARPKDVLRALLKVGFQVNRKTGSHVYLKHPDGRLTSISIHPKPLPSGTLKAILKQTKLKPEELRKHSWERNFYSEGWKDPAMKDTDYLEI